MSYPPSREGPWAELPQTDEAWPNDFPGGICPLCGNRLAARVPTLALEGCIAHEGCVLNAQAGFPPIRVTASPAPYRPWWRRRRSQP